MKAPKASPTKKIDTTPRKGAFLWSPKEADAPNCFGFFRGLGRRSIWGGQFRWGCGNLGGMTEATTAQTPQTSQPSQSELEAALQEALSKQTRIHTLYLSNGAVLSVGKKWPSAKAGKAAPPMQYKDNSGVVREAQLHIAEILYIDEETETSADQEMMIATTKKAHYLLVAASQDIPLNPVEVIKIAEHRVFWDEEKRPFQLVNDQVQDYYQAQLDAFPEDSSEEDQDEVQLPKPEMEPVAASS